MQAAVINRTQKYILLDVATQMVGIAANAGCEYLMLHPARPNNVPACNTGVEIAF